MLISRGNVSIFNRFPRLVGMFLRFYPNMDEFPLSISYNYSCISATMKSILSRLTQTVSGTDKELFNEQELNQFVSFYLDKWDEFSVPSSPSWAHGGMETDATISDETDSLLFFLMKLLPCLSHSFRSPIVSFYQQWAFVVLHNLDPD